MNRFVILTSWKTAKEPTVNTNYENRYPAALSDFSVKGQRAAMAFIDATWDIERINYSDYACAQSIFYRDCPMAEVARLEQILGI